MRTRPINVAALGVGLLAHLVAGAICEDAADALQWFNYGVPVPIQCLAQLSQQAIDFCDGYQLNDPATVYLSTVTPEGPAPVTVSETSTTSTTVTDEISITLPTTAYFSETETTTATAAATVTVGALVRRSPDELPAPVCSLSPANCINPATDCINLSVFNLLQFPAQLLRDICYCMGVAPRTVTYGDLTATVPTNTPTVTAWAVETDVVTDTITGTAYSEVLLTETDMVTATVTTTSTSTIVPVRQ